MKRPGDKRLYDKKVKKHKPKGVKKLPTDKLITSIKQDRLDARTRESRLIESVKEALIDDHIAVTLAVLRNDIACNVAISRLLLERYMDNPEDIIQADGTVPGAINTTLLAVQASTRNSLKEYNRYVTNSKITSAESMADLVLDISSTDEEIRNATKDNPGKN